MAVMRLLFPRLLCIVIGSTSLQLLAPVAAAALSPHARAALAVPKPSPSQLKWQHQELGVIIHYNMITGKGQGCPGMGSTASPPAAALFQPAPDFDATEWMETINALGAKYAVYVAKHGCGFCTWRTNATFMNGTRYPYATGGPNGATSVDVVQAFLKAARAANVLPGFYYSLTSNNFLHHEGVNHTEFESIVMQQIRELWDHENSGDLFEIWMDGGYNPDLKANLSALLLAQQPDSIIFNGCDPVNGCLSDAGNARWIGTEAGTAADNTWDTGTHYGGGDPNSSVWNPPESDTTLQLGDNWFYTPVGIRSLDQLVQVYHTTVGRNTNLLLDIAPLPNGSIPNYAKARYAEFGAWIRACYGKAPAATGTLAASSGRSLVVKTSAAVDRVVLSEDLSAGQLVRGFTLEGDAGGTRGWIPLVSKQSIGHKRIELLQYSENGFAALRLNITATLGDLPPIGVKLQAFEGTGCGLGAPCAPATPGLLIKGRGCSPPWTNQVWALETVAANAGINGSDIVRFRLLQRSKTGQQRSGVDLCLAVSGPAVSPGYPGGNATVVLPCSGSNDTTWPAQWFAFDRNTTTHRTAGGILWPDTAHPGCLTVGCSPGFCEVVSVGEYPASRGSLLGCSENKPWQVFTWVPLGPAEAGVEVGSLRYPDDGHGSGWQCLSACE